MTKETNETLFHYEYRKSESDFEQEISDLLDEAENCLPDYEMRGLLIFLQAKVVYLEDIFGVYPSERL